MNDAHLLFGILELLLDRAHEATDAGLLARTLGRTPTEVAAGLLHLEGKGLVDASRARLTLAGLAAASSLRQQGRVSAAA